MLTSMMVKDNEKTAAEVQISLPVKKHIRSVSDILICILLMAAIAAVSFWFHGSRQTPAIFADELGYISAAKFFSGQQFYNMADATFYHFGYPLFLTPVMWITKNQALQYRLFLCMNTVFLEALFLLLTSISRKLFQCSRKTAFTVSFAVGIYFPIFLQSNFAWSAITVSFFYLLAIWATARACEKNHVLTYIFAGISIGALYAIHPSMIGAAAAGGLLCIAAAFLLKSKKALFLLAGLIPVFIATNLINKWLIESIYQKDTAFGNLSSDSVTNSLGRLSDFRGILLSICGQFLNGFTGTAGLLFIGIFALCCYLLRMYRKKEMHSWKFKTALYFLLSAASIYAISVIQMTGGGRFDHLFYGRYVDPTMIPAILLAVYFLASEGHRHKIFLFAVVPAVAASMSAAVYIWEPGIFLREYNAWMNAIPATLLTSLLPAKNMLLFGCFALAEYAALLAVVFLFPVPIRFILAKAQKAPGQAKLDEGIAESRSRGITIACITAFLIIFNSASIGYAFRNYIFGEPRPLWTISENANSSSLNALISSVKGETVSVTESFLNKNRMSFYIWQYAWDCRFAVVPDDQTDIDTEFYISTEKGPAVSLWGAESAEIYGCGYIYHFPDTRSLTAEITGLDSWNRMVNEVKISSLARKIPSGDHFLEVKSGAMWNPYYDNPDSLGLTLTVDGIPLEPAGQVGYCYYFAIPDEMIEISSITISGQLFSAADLKISCEEDEAGISIEEINTVSGIPAASDEPEGKMYDLGTVLSFTAENDAAKDYLTNGFYNAEPTIIWMSAKSGILLVLSEMPPSGRDLQLSIYVKPIFLPAGMNALDAIVFVNGREAGTWEVSGEGEYSMQIPAAFCQNRDVQIDFIMPDATSPALNGESNDARVLSMGIESMSLSLAG